MIHPVSRNDRSRHQRHFRIGTVGARPARSRLACRSTAIGAVHASINRAELLYGASILPAGRRRDGIRAAVTAIFDNEFAERVLSFDDRAADHYARIVSLRRGLGRPIEGFDAQIAAITAATGYRIATRDIGGFSDCGIDVINHAIRAQTPPSANSQ